jgi:hypothetical protein
MFSGERLARVVPRLGEITTVSEWAVEELVNQGLPVPESSLDVGATRDESTGSSLRRAVPEYCQLLIPTTSNTVAVAAIDDVHTACDISRLQQVPILRLSKRKHLVEALIWRILAEKCSKYPCKPCSAIAKDS